MPCRSGKPVLKDRFQVSSAVTTKRILLIAGLVVAVALIIAASIYLINLNKSPAAARSVRSKRVQPGEESGEVLP